MKNTRKIFIVLVFAMIAVLAVMLAGCKNKGTNYDTETRPLSMSISTPDGVFNPYFSSSAYDSSIVGQTQIGMLSTDAKGGIVAGENEPCVVKDYTVVEATDKSFTTYEFLIKNGIMFSDGQPLTIKDVLFNLYVYLDPAYTGSATIYSTDIVGLKNYRMQQTGETSDSSAFEESFVEKAYFRIQDLIDYVTMVGVGAKSEDRPADRWNDAQKAAMAGDFALVASTFKEELTTDWNNSGVEAYEDWGFTAKWQVFLMNDGGYSELLARDSSNKLIKDENGNYQLSATEAQRVYNEEILPGIADPKYASMSEEDKIKNYCIDSVYESYFPQDGITRTDYSQFTSVVKYWATAATVLDRFTAEAKSAYFAGTDKLVPNITGITTRKTSSFNNATLDGEYDVLTIKINHVDPKAIYNFAFTVSPMHYYSTTNWNGKNYIDAFNGTTEFGLEFGSIDFMNNVINAPEKVGLPLGAGPYKASNASGSGTVTGDNFFNNNMIYYERNTYFETVGRELSNAKIKYLRYKVVESDQIINALANGDIDFGDPSATQENIAAVNNAGLGHVEIDTSGYGYVGINPRFVPNITVRRVIMKAMNTALITQNYYKGGLAEIITRPMSKTSWAYPSSATVYCDENSGVDYSFDSTGYYIDTMLVADGYEKGSDGIYFKEIKGFGKDYLGGTNYKMTIAGGSTDHPAYAMFLKAAEILNNHGFDVKVVTSQTALSDLSNGKLSIWAAAWSSTIDPDMYQVYHIDSQASSTSNWGYKQIKAGKNTEAYSTEYQIITDLSEIIDEGRSTTDKEERKSIYARALDKIMELAVEMPTYQRKDMSAFNKNVLDERSMTPETERSPYNGLLARIWEVTYL
ncbi:MAG: ABC transporter substrate-binding protein [Christensenellales bacterium]